MFLGVLLCLRLPLYRVVHPHGAHVRDEFDAVLRVLHLPDPSGAVEHSVAEEEDGMS